MKTTSTTNQKILFTVPEFSSKFLCSYTSGFKIKMTPSFPMLGDSKTTEKNRPRYPTKPCDYDSFLHASIFEKNAMTHTAKHGFALSLDIIYILLFSWPI